MATAISRYTPLARLVEGIGMLAVVAGALAALNTNAMTFRERRSEIAVMRSLGFGANQILAEAAIECMVIAIPGGSLGVGLAAAMLERARGFVPTLGPLLSFGLPHIVMAGGLGVALVVTLGAGLLAAIQTVRGPVLASLRKNM